MTRKEFSRKAFNATNPKNLSPSMYLKAGKPKVREVRGKEKNNVKLTDDLLMHSNDGHIQAGDAPHHGITS